MLWFFTCFFCPHSYVNLLFLLVNKKSFSDVWYIRKLAFLFSFRHEMRVFNFFLINMVYCRQVSEGHVVLCTNFDLLVCCWYWFHHVCFIYLTCSYISFSQILKPLQWKWWICIVRAFTFLGNWILKKICTVKSFYPRSAMFLYMWVLSWELLMKIDVHI